MKKRRKIIYLLVFIMLLSCKNKNSNVIIEWKLKNRKDEVVTISRGNKKHYNHLFKSQDTLTKLIDTIELKENGYFLLSAKKQSVPIYLKIGQRLTLSFEVDNLLHTIEVKGEGIHELNYLFLKEKIVRKENQGNRYSLGENDFLKRLKNFKKTQIDLLKKIKPPSNFQKNEIKEIEYGIAINKLVYQNVHSHLTGNKNFNVKPEFYDSLNNLNFSDTTSYFNSQTGKYPTLVRFYFEKIANDRKSKYNNSETLSFLKEVDEVFAEGKVKDDLFQFKLRFGLNINDKNMDDIYSIYINAVENEDYKNKLKKEYNILKKLQKGKKAPDFYLENYDGGYSSLKDFKGKYVFIDVWATWCGPCIEEIPSLKKIAKEYQNIKFLTISIDPKKSYKKWRNFVSENKIKATHLIAYKNSDFQENYDIKEIPRYILINKEGLIISYNTYKPSEDKLLKILDGLLK